MRLEESKGGIGAQAVIHLGMHGTVEWLPGLSLGNDRKSWSDELIGDLPNIYVYAANNPSESILAKRRGYGTLVSYNVPPYGRAGLYLELANLRDLIDEYRQAALEESEASESINDDLRDAIWNSVQKSGILNDVPLLLEPSDKNSALKSAGLPEALPSVLFNNWVVELADYLVELQDRLFSSGLHVLGASPDHDALVSYLDAYFGDKLSTGDARKFVLDWKRREMRKQKENQPGMFSFLQHAINTFGIQGQEETSESPVMKEAFHILSLLNQTTEEVDSVIKALDGGYIPAAPGGDLLRDGPSVLPTGRNIHALDPYRMPSAGAWARGQRISRELIRQHQDANAGHYPETVAVTLWGLDAIKTRGESVAIALALVGAKPVKEGTGRIVRFDLIPLEQLGRPRIDVLASLSGIFR
jgi:magnesium chelatase subunit H